VQVATNVAEETSKSFQVFGDSAQSIIDFAKGASSLGLAEDQALQAAAGFGSLFKVIGSSEEEAAGFSKNLTKLAADMASFNNTTVDEALIALSAGLRGESEPLKRFAVFLNDATLKQEALNAGIIKSTKGTLQPAAKALAAYNVILKQTTQQQGDFARTAGGLANLSRIVTAQATNLAGAIGKSFEPIWRGAAEAIGKVLGALEPLAAKVSETVAQTAEAIGSAVAVIGEKYADFISKLDPEAIGLAIASALETAAVSAAGWLDTLRLGIYEAQKFFIRMEGILGDLYKNISLVYDAFTRTQVRQSTGYSDVGAEQEYNRLKRLQDTYGRLKEENLQKMERLRQQFTRTGEFAPSNSQSEIEKRISELPVPESLKKLVEESIAATKAAAALIKSTPTVARPGKDNTIANFQNLVASALSDGTKEAAKQNKISGLDARSQAGLNFLLESGVAGKKPEEETAKNTRPLPSILSELKAIPKTLSVSIP
jgi:hypothetical protein